MIHPGFILPFRAASEPPEWAIIGYGTHVVEVGTENGYDETVSFSSGTMLDTVANNDMCVVAMVADASPAVLYPENFTEIYQTGGTVPAGSVSTKFLTSSDTGFVIGHDAVYKQSVAWAIVRGVNTTTPQDATRTIATVTDAQPNPPAITTATASTMVFSIILIDDEDLASGLSAAPTNYTLLAAEDTGQAFTNGGSTVFMAYRIVASAGSEDPGTWTYSGNDDAVAITMALRWAGS